MPKRINEKTDEEALVDVKLNLPCPRCHRKDCRCGHKAPPTRKKAPNEIKEAAEDPMVGVDTLTVGDKMPQDLLHVLSMFDQGVMRADDFFQFPESEQIIGWGWVDQQPTQDQFGNSWVSLTDKGTKSTKLGTISE